MRGAVGVFWGGCFNSTRICLSALIAVSSVPTGIGPYATLLGIVGCGSVHVLVMFSTAMCNDGRNKLAATLRVACAFIDRGTDANDVFGRLVDTGGIYMGDAR